MELLTFLDEGVKYARIGLNFVRDNLEKVAGWLPWESQITLTILFLAFSAWFGTWIGKKYSTRPWSFPYAIYTIIISCMVFLLLAYL